MKKNLILLSALVLGLVFTYFFQEKGAIFRKSEKIFVFNTQIEKVETETLTIKYREQKYFTTKDLLVSAQKWNEFVSWLDSAIIENELTESHDEQKFFSHPVHFSINGEKFVLGDMHPDQRYFYLKIEKQKRVVVAMFDRAAITLREKEDELLSDRYFTFRAFLTGDESKWIEPNLAQYFTSPFKKINFTGPGRDSFSLFLKENTTFPLPLSGIAAKKDIKNIWEEYFTKISIVKYVANKPDKDLLSIIQLEDENGTNQLSLYHGLNEVTICVDEKDWCFDITPIGAKVFFLNIEDFWEMSPLRDLPQMGFNLSLKNKNTVVPVLVDRRYQEHFKTNKEGTTLNQSNLLELMKLLQGQEPYRVYQVRPCKKIKSEPLSIAYQEYSPVALDFEIYSTKNLLIVRNKATNNCHHYLKNLDQKLSIKLEDYFTMTK